MKLRIFCVLIGHLYTFFEEKVSFFIALSLSLYKEGTRGSDYILNHQKINHFPITSSQPPRSTQFVWGTKGATMNHEKCVCALKEIQTHNGQTLGC